jgi:hypothetical protein
MTAHKKPTSEEIEHQLLADTEKPEAWEHVATVSASRSPRPSSYGSKRLRPLKGLKNATVTKK